MLPTDHGGCPSEKETLTRALLHARLASYLLVNIDKSVVTLRPEQKQESNSSEEQHLDALIMDFLKCQNFQKSDQLMEQLAYLKQQQPYKRQNTVQVDQIKCTVPQKLDRSISEPFPSSLLDKKSINQVRYKTELCRQFVEKGQCQYGEKCQFAHGEQEKRSVERHPKYKTEMCRTYHQQGFCNYGLRCNFIHNEEERKLGQVGAPQNKIATQNKVISPMDVFSGELSFIGGPVCDSSGHSVCRSTSFLCYSSIRNPEKESPAPIALPSSFESSFQLPDPIRLNASPVSGFQSTVGSGMPTNQRSKGRPILSRSVSAAVQPSVSANFINQQSGTDVLCYDNYDPFLL